MALLEFWLSANNGEERFRLPVNPEQLSVKSSHGYEDVQVTQLGEMTIIGDQALREYSFSSFFPRDYHPGYCEYENLLDPWETAAMIDRWMKSKSPVLLTVTGTPINEEVTLRSFQYSERAGSPGDVYYELECKQFVRVEFQKTETIDTSNRPNAKISPKLYIVIPGDTLWKIAQRTLGNGDKWRNIYEANKKTIGKDPNSISAGQKLVIPS